MACLSEKKQGIKTTQKTSSESFLSYLFSSLFSFLGCCLKGKLEVTWIGHPDSFNLNQKINETLKKYESREQHKYYSNLQKPMKKSNQNLYELVKHNALCISN